MSSEGMNAAYDKLVAIGQQAQDEEDFKVAVKHFEKALLLTPDCPFLLYSISICLRRCGEFHAALPPLLRCLDLDPSASDAWYAMGNLRRSLEDLKGAIVAYNKALTNEPTDVYAINNLGLTLRNLDRLEEAEATLKTGLALHPRDADLHYNLGVVLDRRGEPRIALEHYLKAVEAQPDYVEAWEQLEDVYDRLGDTEGARSAGTKARQSAVDLT